MRREERGLGFWPGFLLGGLVGAVGALLLAPQPGEVTRDQLRGRGMELRSRAEEATARARESAEEMMARGRTMVEEKTGMVRSAMEEGRQEAARTAAELREELERARRTGGQMGEA